MDELKRALVNATLKILKQLIRILMRYDISHAEFSEIAKRAYVDAAYDYFSIPSRKTTHSRVAVLTGLSRKEVLRISQLVENEAVILQKTPANRAARVIGGWLRDNDFCQADNEPKPLSLKGSNGSFEELAARYGGDVTVGSILEELQRVGAVTVDGNQTIALCHHAYIPDASRAEKIGIVATCTADLLSTAAHNIENDKDNARFQRQVVYHTIPENVAEEFKNYSHDKSLALLLDYNRWLGKHKNRKGNTGNERTKRIGVGIYHFEE